MDDSRASDYGLMKIDETRRIVHFAEKPKGNLLKSMILIKKISQKFLKTQRDPFGNLLKSNPPRGLTLDHEKVSPFDFFMQVDTTLLGLSDYEALQNPYIASMGVYEALQNPYHFLNIIKPKLLQIIIDAIISHGCFLRECSVEHSVVGICSRLDQDVELKDTMMMGADYYQTDSEIAALVATGRVPIGVGPNTKIT
ncbi:putative glucose-1-phosphate adenylyltransferase [Helianthus debilis subsp. tardiflorus]